MPQLLLDASHSVRVIVVQVGVHVIDNNHRHDGLAAHALKVKLPKARTITLRAAGSASLPREPQGERAYRLVLDSTPSYLPLVCGSLLAILCLGRVEAMELRCCVVHLRVDQAHHRHVAICVEGLDHRIHHVHAMRPRDHQMSRWAATLAVVLTIEVH